MADPALIDGRGVVGGPAQPVVIMNQALPGIGQGTGGATRIEGVPGAVPVTVGGTTFTVTGTEITRPANTNIYALYDIIANEASGTTVVFIPFDTGKVNGSGYITKARLETNRTTEAASYRLYLFRVLQTGLATLLTNLGDNDLFPLKYANLSYRIGWVDFTTFVTAGSGSDSAVSLVVPGTSGGNLPLKYGLATADSKLYGLLTNLSSANTPASAQKFSVSLSFESNT